MSHICVLDHAKAELASVHAADKTAIDQGSGVRPTPPPPPRPAPRISPSRRRTTHRATRIASQHDPAGVPSLSPSPSPSPAPPAPPAPPPPPPPPPPDPSHVFAHHPCTGVAAGGRRLPGNRGPVGLPQGEPRWPTAAIPMENPCCSYKLTRVRSEVSHDGLQLPSLWRTPAAAARSHAFAAQLTIQMSSFNGVYVPRNPMFSGEPWLAAAIPMDNPYCSCRLTRCSRVSHGLRLPSLWRTSTAAVG